MAGGKIRLDRLLWERRLAPSRAAAQALILAGRVLVNEQKVEKPGTGVASDATIRILGGPRGAEAEYVSRAGHKLAAALDHFEVQVAGRLCLDVGASTGGFTDCLLRRGAARVVALDVGTNQLDWRLRRDPRVESRERTNARQLRAEDLPFPPEIITVDVSFISVRLLLPALTAALARGGMLVILIKPQFEAGRAKVGKGGVVRDEAARQAAVESVRQAVSAAGLKVVGVVASPLLGREGNQEFLLAARAPN